MSAVSFSFSNFDCRLAALFGPGLSQGHAGGSAASDGSRWLDLCTALAPCTPLVPSTVLVPERRSHADQAGHRVGQAAHLDRLLDSIGCGGRLLATHVIQRSRRDLVVVCIKESSSIYRRPEIGSPSESAGRRRAGRRGSSCMPRLLMGTVLLASGRWL